MYCQDISLLVKSAQGNQVGLCAEDTVVCQVVRRLPVVKVTPKVAKMIKPKKAKAPKDDKGEEGGSTKYFVVEVDMFCTRGEYRRKGGSIAFAPRFSKLKEEGWWLVVGDSASRELYALKRLSIQDEKKSTARLQFPVNNVPKSAKGVTVFLVSDCYIGLDQEYEVEVPKHFPK